MTFKQAVLQRCMEIAGEKIANLRATLLGLDESLRNETKSTAGDKHETARAMVHIEQANTGRQLQEALAQKAVLDKTDIHSLAAVVISGSLVRTGKGCFFICTGLGKLQLRGETVFALSPQSPLGNKLIGLRIGEIAAVNGMRYVIESIE